MTRSSFSRTSVHARGTPGGPVACGAR
jgi:hypothetical protein